MLWFWTSLGRVSAPRSRGSGSDPAAGVGIGSDNGGISEELVEVFWTNAILSSDVVLAIDNLGLDKFMGVSSRLRGILEGPGAFNIAKAEDESLIALGGNFVVEGSTMGTLGGPNICMEDWKIGLGGIVILRMGVECLVGELRSRFVQLDELLSTKGSGERTMLLGDETLPLSDVLSCITLVASSRRLL